MNKDFQKRLNVVVSSFDALMQCPVLKRTKLPTSLKCGGVYVFSDGTSHQYVGRSKNIRERILQHSRPSVKDAPFAFQLTRKELNRLATYTEDGGRKALLKDPAFCDMLLRKKEWIANLDIRFIQLEDPIDQTLLEIYAADVLKTPYNDFSTT